MSREATGEVRFVGGIWTTRITIKGRERHSFDLPTCRTEPEAEARAAILAKLARRFRSATVSENDRDAAMKAVAGASERLLRVSLAYCEELLGGELDDLGARAPTFQEVGEQWTKGELHTKYPDHVRKKNYDFDAARLEYLCGLDVGGVNLGDVRIDRFTLEHAEAAMRQLPESAKRPSTRRHYAQTIHRVLSLAVYPLRLIAASPLPRGFMPKAGKPPAFSYLYPADDAALMACPDVPLEDRVLFGFLDREGPRAGEAASLPIGAFDLVHGSVRLDENKTDDPRVWALDPGVVRALRAYVARYRAEAAPTDLMFVDRNGGAYASPKLADRLRASLRKAGITRPELFETSAARRQLRAHDLRATFVTLSLAGGRSEAWVADRTGHRTSQMINRYRRAARSAMELGLGSLAPLDLALPELSPLPGIVAGLAKLHGISSEPLPRQFPTNGRGGRRGARQVDDIASVGEVTEWPKVHDWKAPEPITEPAENGCTAEKTADPKSPRQPSAPIVKRPGQSRGNEGGADSTIPSPPDVVEAALADALAKASAAGQWEVVGRLAGELDARRRARAAVVDLTAVRARRGGKS